MTEKSTLKSINQRYESRLKAHFERLSGSSLTSGYTEFSKCGRLNSVICSKSVCSCKNKGGTAEFPSSLIIGEWRAFFIPFYQNQ